MLIKLLPVLEDVGLLRASSELTTIGGIATSDETTLIASAHNV
jgi:hypothetical protein